MAHFLRSLALTIGVALPMSACGGTTRDVWGDAGSGGADGSVPWEHTGLPNGAAFGAGGDGGAGGLEQTGGWVAAGGRRAAGGTTVASGGWTASGGTTVASGGALPEGGAPGTGGCCLAEPVCPPSEAPLIGPDACTHSGCHSITACCTTIWCDPGPCVLSCSPGQVLDPGPCRTPFSCTTHTVCGITYGCYWPVDGGVADSAPPPDCPPQGAQVVSGNPSVCAQIDPICPAQTTYYRGECGCGCMQDPSCPVSVDCSPKVAPVPENPLCTDTARCPYTERVF